MKILVTAPYPPEELQQLEKMLGTVIYQPWMETGKTYSAPELQELLKQTRADALITELDELTQEVIDAWQPKPQFVAICRATPSTIDVEALKQRGIPLFSTPGRNIQAVTEMVIGNIISFYRHVQQSERWLKEGKWTDRYFPYKHFRGQQLWGKKVGLVGLGAVGQSVAKLLEAFSCQISYYDPYIAAERFSNYTPRSLEEIFTENEIVSIHLPALPQTKGLISRELLRLLSKDALFINTSRASVVDYQALFEILEKRHILGAVIDVFTQEPPNEEDMRLIKLDNVLATPHIAGATEEVVSNHARQINEAISGWLSSRPRDVSPHNQT